MDHDYLIDKSYDAMLAYHRKTHRTTIGSRGIMAGRAAVSFMSDAGHFGSEPHKNACHISLKYGAYYASKPVAVMSSVLFYDPWSCHTVAEFAESRKEFLDYLINRSPFNQMFVIKDVEKVLRDKVLYAHTHVPNNLLAAGFITSRTGWEHQDTCYMFHHLKKAGLDEHMAYLVAHIARIWEKKFDLKYAYNNHVAMVPGVFEADDIKAYMEAKPTGVSTKTYYQESTFSGVDKLFTTKDEASNEYVPGVGEQIPMSMTSLWRRLEEKLSDKGKDASASKNNPFKNPRPQMGGPMFKHRDLTPENIQLVADAAKEILKEIA